jgi:hypothetical protein
MLLLYLTGVIARNHGSHFEKHKAAFVEGAAQGDAVLEEERSTDDLPKSVSEKEEIQYKE